MTLKDHFATGRLVVAPGIWDPFSALMARSLGFPAVYLGGNALGLSLGRAQPFVERRDVAEATARISGAAELPVIADLATGFGDPAHVRHSVRDVEAAGAAAVHLDDQIYPKRAHYFRGVTQLSETEDVVRRLDQAVRSRRSDDTLIIARCDALRVEKRLERHLDRLARYVDTGVDGLMILGCSLEDTHVLAREFPGVHIYWTATLAGNLPTTTELEAAPIHCALYPFHGLGAMTAALNDVWSSLKTAGRPGQLPRPGHELVELAQGLVGMELDLAIEKQTVDLTPTERN